MALERLVLVKWIDAETPSNDWLFTNEAHKEAEEPLQVCISVGFLVYEGDHITLAHTDGTDQVKLAIKIPKQMIVSIQNL